jgi:hypothetical protein
LIAIPLIAMPLGFTADHGLSLHQALASGNGHGGGNGGGNGNAGGNGNSNGNAGGNGSGNGNGKRDGNGPAAAGKHADVDHTQDTGFAAGQAEDDNAPGLGALNAAHASPQVLANAAPNSRVGRIETYMGPLDKYLSDLNAGASSAVLSADITVAGLALVRPPTRL